MSKPYIKILNKTEKNRCNCVVWTREKSPKLPYGLWTILNKKKIINARSAKKGRVAIMNVGLPWGHVGIVKEAGGKHITIQEANFKSCTITERHDTEKNLKIIGYFAESKLDKK